MSRFVPVAVTAAVFDRPDLVPPFPPRSDIEAWAAGCSLPARSRKMADTQTLLLYRACSLLFEQNPGLNLHELPCTVAVGPARTDREALLAWSERLVSGEAWPMVSPAAAIGLLPNTPLSWMSIQLGLHGPGSVWSGWSSAGFHALASGILHVRQGSSPALVAAADAPLNYFVLDSRHRANLPDLVAPVELGAALLLGASGPVEIACLQAYPRGTPRPEIFADLACQTGLPPAALAAASLHHPKRPELPKLHERPDSVAIATIAPGSQSETAPTPKPGNTSEMAQTPELVNHPEISDLSGSSTPKPGIHSEMAPTPNPVNHPDLPGLVVSPASELRNQSEVAPAPRMANHFDPSGHVISTTPKSGNQSEAAPTPKPAEFSAVPVPPGEISPGTFIPPEGVVTGLFVAAAVFFFHHELLPLLTVIAVDVDETPRALVLRRRGS
jgi:hypothetical protein